MAVCAGEHGALRVPGGGERGVHGCRFEAQPAAMLQGWTGLEHAPAQLRGCCSRQQVGGAALMEPVVMLGLILKCPNEQLAASEV